MMAIAANGMQQDLMKLETISQNMANVLTPGYKKQILLAQAQAFSQQMGNAQAPIAATPQSASLVAPLVIDASAGTLRYTGNLQDVAIEGEGFFEVAGKDGPAYTRQGNLHPDARGRLVGSQGMPVMGASGEIVLNGSAFSIDANGDVRQGERLAGRLKLVRFANPEALQPAGGGLYIQGGARVAEAAGPAGPATVRAGYQENSNVNSPQEMVRLTETVRHFEALQKIMQGYDDSLEKTIRKLGEF
ncbi:flagellar hook basal-body protein [Oxalobacteraceae bacterium]|nr:flagellar hook basal-body protein [Oxalobacteraceae bacterium]